SMAEGVGKALISDIVPSQQRAGAIGLIYTVAGFGQLVGSIAVGATWRLMVPGTSLRMPFAIDAALATAAGLLLLFCGGTQRQRERQLS
ncbi:MAG TPA: MFS transporter, partial [Planctomycetota bacterium]|nr:MFS transporter [Planctomycetota bacterium]